MHKWEKESMIQQSCELELLDVRAVGEGDESVRRGFEEGRLSTSRFQKHLSQTVSMMTEALLSIISIWE